MACAIHRVILHRQADVTDIAWIDNAITSARPQAISALLRYFRDLDTAEEAFQDACLRALKTWPKNGRRAIPRRGLILVGRNVALDGARRKRKQTSLRMKTSSPISMMSKRSS